MFSDDTPLVSQVFGYRASTAAPALEDRRPDGISVLDTHEQRIEAAANRERVRRAARRIVDDEERQAQNAPTPQLVRAADLRDLNARAHLVQGVVTPDSLCFLWGPSNGGKTTIAIDLAMALATGGQWCGRACQRVSVALLTYEGQYAMRARIAAAARGRGTDLSAIDVYVVEAPPFLADAAGVAALGERFRAAGVLFVVVDTLTAACAGALDIDAGAGGDAGKALAALRALRADGGAVMAIHHCGHDVSRMRGAYALLAAADTELRAADRTLRTGKQRDLPSDLCVAYQIEQMYGSVVVTYETPAGRLAAQEDEYEKNIAKLIAENPSRSANWIADRVKGNRKKALDTVRKLRTSGSGGLGTSPEPAELPERTGSAVPGPGKARNGTSARAVSGRAVL